MGVNRKKVMLATLLVILVAVSSGWFVVEPIRKRAVMYWESDSIGTAVRRYFACEVNGDYEKLYACLAPSSIYRQSHDYRHFLEEAHSSPVRVQAYEIIGFYNIRENVDLKIYPKIRRYVEVEVEVVLINVATNQQSHSNRRFIFIKEGGEWLKG